MVIPRAIVRDLADGHAAARLMSRLMLVMGAAPILAPSLGGLVLAFAGWQAIFWICAGYGAIVLRAGGGAAARYAAAGPARATGARRACVSATASILRERGFITHALAGGFTTFGFFAYLGGSPGVFEDIYHLGAGRPTGRCSAPARPGSSPARRSTRCLVMRFGLERVLRAACG